MKCAELPSIQPITLTRQFFRHWRRLASAGALAILAGLVVPHTNGATRTSPSATRIAKSAAAPTPTAAPSGQIKHVVMVLEENHDYGQIIGNGQMPHTNALADGGGLATNYFAVTHPSIGNYFSLTTG